MEKNILIIDDEKIQAEGLKRVLGKKNPEANIFIAFEEEDIFQKIEATFYNLAIVDLRMDSYEYDGIDIIKKIIIENPFAKIIVVSEVLPIFKASGRLLLIKIKQHSGKDSLVFCDQFLDAFCNCNVGQIGRLPGKGQDRFSRDLDRCIFV